VNGGYRKLLNKLYYLYSSAVIIRMTKEKSTWRTVCEMDEILVQKFCRKTWREGTTWKT